MLAVILVMVAFAFWVQKFRGFKTLGPALIVIITGIILVNLKIVPGSCEIYGTISTYCIPISISLYLLDVDLQQIVKMSKQPLLAIASAVFCVSIVSIVFGSIFGDKVAEGWKVAGMFVGTYTGGSSNLTAIATGLNASGDTIAAANAADYVIGMPSLILMFLAPTYMKTSKWFQKFLHREGAGRKWRYEGADGIRRVEHQGNRNPPRGFDLYRRHLHEAGNIVPS